MVAPAPSANPIATKSAAEPTATRPHGRPNARATLALSLVIGQGTLTRLSDDAASPARAFLPAATG
jgi:hypothetical protein